MNDFLKSLLSKKLAFAAAAEALVQSLHTTADAKAQWTALIAFAYVLAQAWVDAHEVKANNPPPSIELKVDTVPPPPAKEETQ